MPFRILVVDDDHQMTDVLKKLLQVRGYHVRMSNNSMKALEAAREFQPHVAILDFQMPEAHGGDVAWQFWSDPQLRKTKLVVYSAVPKAELPRQMPPTAIPIFEKPLDTTPLLALLEKWAQWTEAEA